MGKGIGAGELFKNTSFLMMYLIKKRLRDFELLGSRGFVEFDFSPFLDLKIRANIKTELAFCISTANSSAVSGLRFQKLLENLKIDDISVDEIEEILRISHVRFHSKKAVYIKSAIDSFDVVERALKMNTKDAREYLVRMMKGLGYKEASHFLRNVGRFDVAIIDRHVLGWLRERGYIEEIHGSLKSSEYKRIEGILREIASERGVTLAELDLMIWYEKTGKILK